MKWIVSIVLPFLTAIGAAWVYLDIFLTTKKNKEAMVGNAFLTLSYWKFWIVFLVPLTVLLTTFMWKRLESMRNRVVVAGCNLLLIILALLVPHMIIKLFWV